jgi:hypothetical protein
MITQPLSSDFTSERIAVWLAAIGAWAAVAAAVWLALRANQLIRAMREAEIQRAAGSVRTAAYFLFTDIAHYKAQLEMAQGLVEYVMKNLSLSLSDVQRLLKGRISLPALADNPALIGQLPHTLAVQMANLASEIRAGEQKIEEFELAVTLDPDQSVHQSSSAQSALQSMQAMLGTLLPTVRSAEQGLSKFIYPETAG